MSQPEDKKQQQKQQDQERVLMKAADSKKSLVRRKEQDSSDDDEEEEDAKLPDGTFPVNQCNYLLCPLRVKSVFVSDSMLRRCERCKIAYYCSPSCQKKDWKGVGVTSEDAKNNHPPHKSICKQLSAEQVEWVQMMREHIAMVRNTEDLRVNILRDARQEYYRDFDPALDDNPSLVCRRGIMCIDLVRQKQRDECNAPQLTDKQGRKMTGGAMAGVRASELQYWYLPVNDAQLQKNRDQYARALKLAEQYDPDTEFVLLTLCTNANTDVEARICEIVSGVVRAPAKS